MTQSSSESTPNETISTEGLGLAPIKREGGTFCLACGAEGVADGRLHCAHDGLEDEGPETRWLEIPLTQAKWRALQAAFPELEIEDWDGGW